jgi:hypothetical protein
MSEFAFSGVGINPHHGTPTNPATARLDPTLRIPGGSTSGGAVSVAAGAAWAALGSDTGGSIRIPAALQGIVGFKGTARRVPIAGAVPLASTLDTVSAMTLSVRDAVLLHEVLADRRVELAGRPIASLRFAVPRTMVLDGLDPTVARAFDRALSGLAAAGAAIENIACRCAARSHRSTPAAASPLRAGLAPQASRRTRRRLRPRVALRFGAARRAADYIELLASACDWIARMEAALGPPTPISRPVPMVAPAIGPSSPATRPSCRQRPAPAQPVDRQPADGCALALTRGGQEAAGRADALDWRCVTMPSSTRRSRRAALASRSDASSPRPRADMRVAVIGAGVIGDDGVQLGADGPTTVFERRGTVAAESSFANAGLVAPGYVSPWSAPGMPGKVISHLWREHSPVRFGGRPDLSTIGWLWRWWRACKPATYRANRARMHRLAHFSRDRLHELIARLHLDFERASGFLVLLRSPHDLVLAEPGIRALTELGVAPQLLDAAGCRQVEPGLNPETALHAGVYSKDDGGRQRRGSPPAAQGRRTRRVQFPLRDQVERIIAGASRGWWSRHAARSPRRGRVGLARRPVSWWRPSPGRDDGEMASMRWWCARRSVPTPCSGRWACACRAVSWLSVTAPLRHDEAHPHLEPRGADGRRYGWRPAASAIASGGRQRRDRRPARRQNEAAHSLSTRCSTTGFRASPGAARRSAGRRTAYAAGGPPCSAEWRRRGVAQSRPWRQRLGLACGSAKLVADWSPAGPPSASTGWASNGSGAGK